LAEILHKAGQPEIGQGRPLGEASLWLVNLKVYVFPAKLIVFSMVPLWCYGTRNKSKTIQISKAKKLRKTKKPF